MVKQAYIPDRRDIVWIDLNPTRGHEQAKVRPALVLSPRAYNQKTKLALLCPITSEKKGYPFEVAVSAKEVQGVVLADHVRSWAWGERRARFIEKASPKVVQSVIERLQLLLT